MTPTASFSSLEKTPSDFRRIAVLCYVAGGCAWRVRVRHLQHHRGLPGGLQEAAQPRGHGHRHHLHRAGTVANGQCNNEYNYCRESVSVSLDGGNNVILPVSMGSCCQLHLDTLLIQPCLWIIHQRSQKTKNLKMSCLVPLMNVRRGQISICILLKYWPTYGRASHLIWLQCPGYPAAAVYPRRGAEEDCECGPGQWSAIQSHGRKNKE